MCTVRAAHTCRSLMPKRSSTTYAPRGPSDSLQPGFPASEANLASFLPRMGVMCWRLAECSSGCGQSSHLSVRDACAGYLYRRGSWACVAAARGAHLEVSPCSRLDAAPPRSAAVLTYLSVSSSRPSCSARSGRCQAIRLARPDHQRASAGRREGRNELVFMAKTKTTRARRYIPLPGRLLPMARTSCSMSLSPPEAECAADMSGTGGTGRASGACAVSRKMSACNPGITDS